MKKLAVFPLLAGIFAAANISTAAPVQKINVRTFSQSQRLNNLVQTITYMTRARGGQLTVEFTLSAEQWVFLQFSTPVKNFQMQCNGKEVASGKDFLLKNQEFMRELPPGKYTVKAESADRDPQVELSLKHLNKIPEIYYYAPANVGGMEVLDGSDHWEQIGEQLLSSTNLLAPAALTIEQQQLYRQAGRKIFFNTASHPVSQHKVEVFAANVQSKLDMEIFDGFTVDEFDFKNPDGSMGYRDYGKALKLVKNPQNKRMYTWSYGVKYTEKPEQLAFARLCANPPSGKGRLMTEVYLESKETEAEAKAFIERRIAEDAASILREIPGLAPHYGIVLGNFNAMPILTQEVVPEVDYKYYLDWQMYTIANHTACKDLGLVGYWGGNYCQEELQRWSLLLLRHYFVEGKKTMLSHEYGFSYRPGILNNGDFLRDLSSWEVFPAEKDSIRQDAVKDHGYLMQCRWGSTKSADGIPYNGDTVAVMTRSADGVNIIQQNMENLTPGKPYVLHYVAGSYDDAVNKVNNPRDYGIYAEIDPSEAEIKYQGLYIDRREKHRYRDTADFSRANLHRIIFVPKKSEVMLKLTDRKSQEKPGTRLMVNFVQVKPYFAREMMK
ncbi:MAG: hypothetical protein E7047_01195 [Lentisphaerae bacterium]|nr:hypothetical protein [Lentisphaerota bacterium]